MAMHLKLTRAATFVTVPVTLIGTLASYMSAVQTGYFTAIMASVLVLDYEVVTRSTFYNLFIPAEWILWRNVGVAFFDQMGDYFLKRYFKLPTTMLRCALKACFLVVQACVLWIITAILVDILNTLQFIG